MAQIWGISFGSLQRLKTLTKAKPFLMPTVVTQKPNIFNEEAKNIVFTGTLSWSENYIGLRWFIQNCWDTIHKKHPKTKLFVVGQQADNSWNKLIQKHTNIELLGYVEKLEDVYKNCALAISPVFINVGIKIKVLTYLSYGLPVLATKASLGGMKSGKGIIAASKKNFVEQADILLSNSSVRKKISKDSQENIRINHSNKTLNDFFLKTKVFS